MSFGVQLMQIMVRAHMVGVCYEYQNRPWEIFIRVRPHQVEQARALVEPIRTFGCKIHYNALNSAELMFATNFMFIIK
jgi:hypothetical protein